MTSIFYIIGAFCAIGFASSIVLAKKAYREGATFIQVAVASNFFTPLLFVPLLFMTELNVDWSEIFWPIFMGVGMFIGMVLYFKAIKMGDVSIQSSILAGKVVPTAAISIILGLEKLTIPFVASVFLIVIGIFFVSRDENILSKNNDRQKNTYKKIVLPILTALLAISFFSIPDLTLQEKSGNFGRVPFLVLSFSVCAILLLIYSHIKKSVLRKVPRSSRKWVCFSGAFASLSYAFSGYAVSYFGNANGMNIMVSTRGLLATIIVAIFAKRLMFNEAKLKKKIIIYRLIGAGFMLCSVVIMVLL